MKKHHFFSLIGSKGNLIDTPMLVRGICVSVGPQEKHQIHGNKMLFEKTGFFSKKVKKK